MTPTHRTFTFQPLTGLFAVVQMPPDSAIPPWATSGRFFSVTRTDDELSIVCDQASVPPKLTTSPDWACLKLVGPFAFDDTGIVAAVTQTLATAQIGVFVVSTFDGDHILVKASEQGKAVMALRGAGHTVRT